MSLTAYRGHSRVDYGVLPQQGADPAVIASAGILYTKSVSGTAELFYEDSAGNIQQLTSGGGGGPIISVNGDIGPIVVLDTSDITLDGTFTPGAGTIAGTDTIQQALQKLQGNITSEDTWDRGTGTLYPHTITDFVGIGTIPEVLAHIKDGDSGVSPTGDIFWESSSILNQEIAFGSGANYQINVYEGGSGESWQLVFDGSTNEFRMFNSSIGQFFVQRSSEIVINEAGASVDFRVEGDTDTNALFVQGSTNFTGFGTNSPLSRGHFFVGSSSGATPFANTGVFIEGSTDTYLSILTSTTGTGGVLLGDSGSNVQATILYNNSTDVLKISTLGDEKIAFKSGETVVNDTGQSFDFRVESDTDANALFVNGSTNSVGVGTASPVRKLHVLIDDTRNNTITNPLRVTHTTSGTPGAGIGTGIEFETETASGNTVGTDIQSITDTVTGGSETYHALVRTMKNGTIGNALYIDQDSIQVYSGIIRLNPGFLAGSILYQSNIVNIDGGSSGITLSDSSGNPQIILNSSNQVTVGSLAVKGGNTFQVATGNVNYGLSQATVNTTNATVTTIQTIAIPTNKTVMLKSKVVARRTGGSSGTTGDSAYYERTVAIKDIAGTVTIGIVQTDFTYEDQVAWDVTFAVSSTNILVQVTGAASNNVTWDVTTIFQQCSA